MVKYNSLKNLALRNLFFLVMMKISISESSFKELNVIELHRNISEMNGNDLYRFQNLFIFVVNSSMYLFFSFREKSLFIVWFVLSFFAQYSKISEFSGTG